MRCILSFSSCGKSAKVCNGGDGGVGANVGGNDIMTGSSIMLIG